MDKKIFIIEDDENILYGLQESFTSEGYDVSTNDGTEEMEEIIKKIKAYHPDYIILDLVLPKIDGLEIVKKMKGDEDLENVQVFIFTDLSDNDAKNRSVGLGVDHYFLKSDMDVYEFSEKVKNVIENREEDSKAEDDEDDLVME